MRKLKVVHVSIGLQWGGAETLMANIAGRLNPDEFEVKVVALQGEGPIGDQLRKANIPVTVLHLGGGWDLRAYSRLKDYLAQEKPDIVHAHLLRANLLACLAREKYAVIWHEHGTGEWLNSFMRLMESRLMIHSDAVIAISNNVRDTLVARVPKVASHVSVLPNAIDTKSSSPVTPVEKYRLRQKAWGLGPEHRVVGFVGRLDDKFKGISFLLKSIAQLRATMPDLRLIIVGEGNDRTALEKLSQRLGIKDTVSFAGPRAYLSQIYPTFDVLALPSLSEGFGIVLLEAMAYGIPVVASSVGGIPEVVLDHETGLLVTPGDTQTLTQALDEMLRDPAKGTRMGEKGLDRARTHFDLGNVVLKLEELYRDVFKRKGGIQ